MEPATLVAEPDLMVVSSTYSAGIGRTTARWAYSSGTTVKCPWCSVEVAPRPAKPKKERKKVPLTVLLCPFCESAWQWRGELPEAAACPVCHRDSRPSDGNVPDGGKFICPTCGMNDAIIRSIRQLPEDELLPIHPYAVQGYCARCGPDQAEDEEHDGDEQPDLLEDRPARSRRAVLSPDHPCLLTKSSGKFFTRVRPADLARYRTACEVWDREKDGLPHPASEIPDGQETHRLLEHHYRFWRQMFNPRQLLCLSTLLAAIAEEADLALQDMLLTSFHSLLERNNLFCRYYNDRNTVQGNFARHDYQSKLDPTETNIWGHAAWRGTLPNLHLRTLEGKAYGAQSYDWRKNGTGKNAVSSLETVYRDSARLEPVDARSLQWIPDASVDLVITDPPYAGNLNYAELADFFYVWLRLILGRKYAAFAPEVTPKAEEIIENAVRGKTIADFGTDLTAALSECARKAAPDALLVFTFHHAEGRAWEAVLKSVCEGGFELLAAYPVHGEKESSLHLQDKGAIAYDLVHVCRKAAA